MNRIKNFCTQNRKTKKKDWVMNMSVFEKNALSVTKIKMGKQLGIWE
jgi:hypothetical protein